MRHRRTFDKAFLNKDDDKKYNANSSVMENVSIFEYGDNGVVKNIKGTSLESPPYTQDAPEGFIDDGWDIVNVFNKGNYLYAFICNETIATGDVDSKLKRIEVNTNTVETILDDTPFPSIGKYNFSRSHPVYSMVLVDETYAAWTDNNSQPMIVKIDDGIADPHIEKESLYLIKKPPHEEPSASIIVGDYTREDLVDEGYQFCYYYIYKNNFESAMSFYSDTLLVDNESGAEKIEIGYNTGGGEVEYAVICFRYLGSTTLYQIDKVDVKNKIDQQETIYFRNDLSYSLIPDSKKNKLFDNVPIKAKTISHFNSLIGLNNYYEGYDEDIVVDANVSFNTFSESIKADEQSYDSRPTPDGATQTFDVSTLDTGVYNSSYVVKVYVKILSDKGDSVNPRPPGKTIDFSYTLTSNHDSFQLFFNNVLKPKILARTKFEDENSTIKQMFESITHNGVGEIEFDTRDTAPFYYLYSISIELYPYSSFNTFLPKMIQYGLQYYDEYNRSMGYHKIGNGIEIDDVYESQQIEINHAAPAHAVKYKVVRAASKDFFRRVSYLRTDAYLIPPEEMPYSFFQDGEVYYKLMVRIDPEEFIEEGHRAFIYLKNAGEDSGKKMLAFVSDGKEDYDDEVDGSEYTGTYLILKTKEADYANDAFYAIKYLDPGAATIFHEEVEYTPGSDALFYELPGTYDVTNQEHQANTQNQDTATDTPALLTINDGDIVFNGEQKTKKIKEGVYYDRVGRPSFLLREKLQQHRTASTTVSEKYVEETGYNGLNSFDTNQNNFYNYDIDNGAITHVEPYFEDIIVFQEHSVLRHGIRKNILTSESGEISVEVGRTFGEKREYLGGFGLSNPMSVKQYKGRIYFVDSGNTKRIGRLAGDGIEDIAGEKQKMLYYFQRFIPNDISDYQILSGIKPREDKYVLNINDGQNNLVLDYDINKGVWTYSETFTPDFIVNSRSDLFSFKDEGFYKHNSSNNFYGDTFTSKMRFYLNELGQGNNVVITNVWLESSKPLKVRVADKDGANSATISPSDFEKKEGYYYASLPKTIMSESISSMAIHAIGEVMSFENLGENSVIRITGGLNTQGVNVGNDIYKVKSPEDVVIGQLSGVYKDRIYTDSDITEPITGGDFLYTKTPEALEGDDLRSDVFTVDILEEDGDAFVLEAINFEYDVSSV